MRIAYATTEELIARRRFGKHAVAGRHTASIDEAAVLQAGNIGREHLDALREVLEICLTECGLAYLDEVSERERFKHLAKLRQLARLCERVERLFSKVDPTSLAIAECAFSARLERPPLPGIANYAYTARRDGYPGLADCLAALVHACNTAVPGVQRGRKETTFALKQVMLVLHDFWVNDLGRVFSDEFFQGFHADADPDLGELSPKNDCSRFCVEALRQVVDPAPSVGTCRHVMRKVKGMKSADRQPSSLR